MMAWRRLSRQEQKAVLVERGQQAHKSGISDQTLDDILVSAF